MTDEERFAKHTHDAQVGGLLIESGNYIMGEPFADKGRYVSRIRSFPMGFY